MQHPVGRANPRCMIRVDAVACAAALSLLACTPPAQTSKGEGDYPVPELSTEGDVLAKVGPVTLTTSELEKRVQAQTPFARMQLQDPKRMQEFVKNEVRLEILAQEAWRRALQDDPEIILQFKRILTQRLIQDEMKRLASTIQVSDGEALKAYEKKKSEFVKPATVRLAQIVRYVETGTERKAAEKLLRATREKVLAQERKNNYRAFSNAAKKSSQDEGTRNSGGDLQFLTRAQLTDRYGEEVAKHMFDEVKVGDLAVANAPNAVVLFKKTGMRRGVNRTFDQVKSQLRGRLSQQRRSEAFNAFVERLKTEQGITVDLDKANQIKLAPSGVTKPPGVARPPAKKSVPANQPASAPSAGGAASSKP